MRHRRVRAGTSPNYSLTSVEALKNHLARGRGRKPVPLADQVFAATMKVYSLFSGPARFMSDLDESQRRGFVAGMQFNAVLRGPSETPR